MALPAGLDTGGGSFESSSSAEGKQSVTTGARTYGGINIAPAIDGFSFGLTPTTIGIGVAAVLLYFYAKKKNYV